MAKALREIRKCRPVLTSTRGPIVAANASGESDPKLAMATAIASSLGVGRHQKSEK